MLHVTRLTDRTGAYYLADCAVELGAHAAPGQWVGAGARDLGLSGDVGARELAGVLQGRAPATGRPLVTEGRSVTAYDLTFTAPKSVSVLFALGRDTDPATVITAHACAVDAALGYLAERALTGRRHHGAERTVVAVDGLVGAAFGHGLSRDGDPHVHSHVLVANLGHGGDGRWSALDGRALFAHARAAGAIYGAELRQRLTGALGVGWVARESGFDVAGVDPTLVGEFSGRSAAIRAHLYDWERTGGRPSGGARHTAWAATRPAKEHGPSDRERREGWARRAVRAGQSQENLALATTGRGDLAVDLDERRFAARLADARAPTRREAVAAWADSLPAGAPAAWVGGCVDRLADWGTEVGVAERATAPGPLVASARQRRVLGARPRTPSTLGTWQRGARALDTYHRRWGEDGRSPDPGDPAARRGLSAVRLADHLATEHSARRGPPRARSAHGRVARARHVGPRPVLSGQRSRPSNERSRPEVSWRHGSLRWAGVSETHPRRFRASMAKAAPGAPRAMASTGRRRRRTVEVETEGRTRPLACFAAPIVRVATSRSPPSADSASRVGRSAMPGRTTVVPNRDTNASAWRPQRARAWERSWRHARVKSPCPAPSLTIVGRSGMGAMLATSSSAKRTGCPSGSRW